MKRGPNSIAPVVLTLYEGADATGTVIDTASLGPAAFTQSFAPVSFMFPAAVSLLASQQYFVTLSSIAATTGSAQYFIKGTSSTLMFSDGDGNPIPTGYITAGDGSTPTGPETAVPEPFGAALFATALLGMALVRPAHRGSARA